MTYDHSVEHRTGTSVPEMKDIDNIRSWLFKTFSNQWSRELERRNGSLKFDFPKMTAEERAEQIRDPVDRCPHLDVVFVKVYLREIVLGFIEDKVTS
jgi:hypothetical protein